MGAYLSHCVFVICVSILRVSISGGAREELNYGIDRFLSEAKLLAKFEHHPNIVSVRDFFEPTTPRYCLRGRSCCLCFLFD